MMRIQKRKLKVVENFRTGYVGEGYNNRMENIKILKTPGIVSTIMDSEMVLLNVDTGEYFVLNKVGALIWDLLENSLKGSEIVGAITDKFEVTAERAESDYQAFLSELQEKGLVSVSESA
jgi:hypothetical protein